MVKKVRVEDVELSHEECEVLYKAEYLLGEMFDAIELETDKKESLRHALSSLGRVCCDYNVHIECDPNY